MNELIARRVAVAASIADRSLRSRAAARNG